MEPDRPPFRRPMHTVRPPQPSSAHRRWLWLIVALIVIVAFGGKSWLSYYLDSLWFGSLGYEAVFWKTLGLQWAVFAVSAVVTFLLLYGTFLILRRTEFTPDTRGHTILIGARVVT